MVSRKCRSVQNQWMYFWRNNHFRQVCTPYSIRVGVFCKVLIIECINDRSLTTITKRRLKNSDKRNKKKKEILKQLQSTYNDGYVPTTVPFEMHSSTPNHPNVTPSQDTNKKMSDIESKESVLDFLDKKIILDHTTFPAKFPGLYSW